MSLPDSAFPCLLLAVGDLVLEAVQQELLAGDGFREELEGTVGEVGEGELLCERADLSDSVHRESPPFHKLS